MNDSDKDSSGLEETVAADSSGESATLPSARAVGGKSDEFADANTEAAALPGPQAPSGLAPGTVIARYRLLEPLGDGGMGTVWRARDTELARDVAIKLVHPKLLADSASGSANTSRLFREAQALAQLSHPNVVPVFDVGTTERDEVWVAMEHVVGVPGDRWASKSERSWSEIVAIYRQVGEGLAAAHHAGIVHRDFKPANFVVGVDGRVRVLDFGLARKSAANSAKASAPSESTELSALSDAVTVAGAILGTPAYMSPEQMTGKTAEAPSDQYSFAVALWEALYGAHPYPAKTFTELRGLVQEGIIAAPQAGEIPPRFEAALRRAMSNEVDNRYGSMEALLEAIEPPVRKRKMALLAGAATVAIGIGAFAFIGLQSAPAACPRDDAGWKEAVAPEVVQRLEARLPKVAPAIIAELASKRESWISSRQAACRAHSEGYETDEMFRHRLACLDEARSQANSMPALLGGDDAIEGEQAFHAILELARPEDCTGTSSTWLGELDSADERELVDELRTALLRFQTSHNAAQLGNAEALVKRARDTSSLAILGRALTLRAMLYQRVRKYSESEKDLREALEVFAEAKVDHFAPQAWTSLVEVVGAQGHIREARSLATVAKTTAKYGDSPESLARLENSLATLDENEGKLAEAGERFASARRAFVKALGEDSFRLVAVDGNLGRIALLRAEPKAAIEHFERASDIAAKNHSQSGPSALNAQLGLAQAHSLMGDDKRAIAIYEQVLETQKLTLGAEHPATIDTTFMLGSVLASNRKLKRAVKLMREGLAVQEKNADKRTIANALASLGNVEIDLGLYDEAIATLSRGRGIYEELSDKGLSLVATLLPLGKAHRLNADCSAAAEPMNTARVLLESVPVTVHEFTGLTYAEEAHCLLVAKDFAGAAQLFEKAIATYGDKPHVRTTRAEALWGLGQAEARIRARRSQARAHVQEALTLFDSSPDHDAKLRAEASAWLTSHK